MISQAIELSIIVPAHNEEKYLRETLQSIFTAAQAAQVGYEVIVVDDDSTDETSAIATQAGAQVEQVQLRNIGAVRNAGAKIAKGKWLIFIDADTLLPAETLLATIEELRGGAVGGGAQVDLNDLSSLPWIKRMMYYTVVIGWQKLGRWAAGCYMFCQASAFAKFGGFDESYFAAEEYFFSKALKRLGKFKLLKTPVVTSSRKLHAYSTAQLARLIIRPLFVRTGFFKSKTGLEILYEDKR
jgi:glycosyltransferase involved in cell wall biosynthesis